MEEKGYITVPMLECRFIEFLRIDTVDDMAAVTAALLGDGAAASDFANVFGISLDDFKGFYVELSYSDAPRGPVLPSIVAPILALRKTRSGATFKPNILKVRGYYNQSKKNAWVEASEWEEQLGDDLARNIRDRIQELDEKTKRDPLRKLLIDGKEVSLEELADLIRDPGIGKE